ncbi:nucleotidyltransferase family protein [Caldivirga maquilingensis]|uniref:Uncharacterized protein n=1 Tax=Caldivirga maquilingensis (strain ATCC 700844 / DSM 13496 / JCM 10307 / IC-167) TaxID=397948 RepID=A8M967_CALMQ|nr:nucleotidyltransferase family protein [Caldivirga maquilingensis]ABW02286.1 hypothetical protein Cmaq_1462 [Caldivirga maquilingensis IC-167]
MVLEDTIRLMRIIGIPGLIKGRGDHGLDADLLALAELNKVQLLVDDKYLGRYGEFLGFLEYVVRRMDGLEYTVVKTLKPFRRIPSDIDLVVRREDLGRVIRMFRNNGLRLLDWAPYGATLHSTSYNYYLDVTTDLSVSGLVYISGEYLITHTVDRRINGVKVRAPVEPLDLLATIAHSVIKEWMFTLSDYYTAVLWLSNLTRVLRYARELHLTKSLMLFISMVKELSDLAFGQNNPVSNVVRVLAPLNVRDNLKSELPIKYSPRYLIPCYTERFMNTETLTRMPTALRAALNTGFLRLLINHALRSSY